jgi:hypothetical protein
MPLIRDSSAKPRCKADHRAARYDRRLGTVDVGPQRFQLAMATTGSKVDLRSNDRVTLSQY